MGVLTMRKPFVGVAVCAATVIGFGGSAFAGEWGPGKPGDGYTPIKSDHVAGSECAFSGRDEPDENNGGAETEDPELGYDDGLWMLTPTGGNVQSPGQLVALFGSGQAGAPGQACRGNGG